MNWKKLILLLFILFYFKEVKTKKPDRSSNNQNYALFASEDLLLFVDDNDSADEHIRRKRELEASTQETGSGSPETTFTTFISSTSTSTTTTTQNTRIITSSTSTDTTSTTTTTVTTTTTTTPPSKLIVGPNDASLLYYWRANLQARKSMPVFTTDIDLTMFGNLYNYFRVHPNGLLSFPSDMLNFIMNAAPSSISDFKVPVIAPFLTSSTLTQDSDIRYGVYTQKTLTADALNKIAYYIGNTSSSSTLKSSKLVKSSSSDAFVPEITFLITWNRVQLTSNPSDTASYQLILTSSVTQRKSYVIINYDRITITSSKVPNVLIGYTNGGSQTFTNSYSLLGNATGDPTLITQYSNTNTPGVWVYSMDYGTSDACTIWYQSVIISYDYVPITPNNQSFVRCSSDSTGASANPSYQKYTGAFWGSSNSTCYKLISNVQGFLQQFCCYDKTTGALQTSGPTAGFFYNIANFGDIMNHGFLCCYKQSWSTCSRFYKIYPPSIVTNDGSGFVAGSGGGDPHIDTFDHAGYAFNGYGKFIMSRALDASYEIQIATELFRNVNGSDTLTGTFIRSLAVSSLDSPIIQLDLIDYLAPNPYFVLYLDQNNQAVENFTRNMNYRLDLPCEESPSIECATILQTREKVQILFSTGLNIQVKITKVDLSQYESRSWMSVDIVLPRTYSNAVEGLMGNFNGQTNDDLRSRSGLVISPNSTDEVIYNTLVSWRVSPSEGDEDLFVAGLHSSKMSKTAKFALRSSHDFTPVFFETLDVDATTHELCNGSRQCIYDTIVTGLLGVGLSAIHEANAHKQALHIIDNEPPIIEFRNSTIHLDWSREDTPVNIVAHIVDPDGVRVSIHVENASVYSTDIHAINTTYSIVQIVYRIRRGEYPFFRIIATDSKSRTAVGQVDGMLVCNCRRSHDDTENVCVYDQVLFKVNPSISMVACQCADYYSGLYCENVRDECSVVNMCNLVPAIKMECQSLSLEEQKRTSRAYRCLGECPSGYGRNEYDACIDIDECETASDICPSEAKCVNFVGSYKCECSKGSMLVADVDGNKSCQKIDYCSSELNMCDSICTSSDTGPVCSCLYGYELASDRRTCRRRREIDIAGCKSLGCSHMCTTRHPDGTGQAVCRCHKGYRLDQNDAKSCININECAVNNAGCPGNCTDLPGSFRCECELGKFYDLSSNSCHVCPNMKYGLDCSETCVLGVNSLRCDPVHGPVCNPGFTGPDCSVAIDACQNTHLPANMICQMRSNRMEISCHPGYAYDNVSHKCILLNSCQPHSCPLDAKCVSGLNTFTCLCPSGYVYDEIKHECLDVNECAHGGERLCPENSFCLNTAGSYECICDNWFINTSQDTRDPKCEDIDECALNISRCLASSEQCVNLPGSYTCECRPGYVYSHVRVACVQPRDLLPATLKPPTLSSVNKINSNHPVANSGLAKSNQSNDRIGILLVILLPVFVLLLLVLFALLACYCWFRIRTDEQSSTISQDQPTRQISAAAAAMRKTSRQVQPTTTSVNQADVPYRPRSLKLLREKQFKSNLPISMPSTPSDRQHASAAIHHDLIDLETDLLPPQRFLPTSPLAAAAAATRHEDRTIYRTAYTPTTTTTVNNNNNNNYYPQTTNPSSCSDDFFKSLEENARTYQRTTITRPAFAHPMSSKTESTFSLPVAYYENTTPYSEFLTVGGNLLLDRSHSEHDLQLFETANSVFAVNNEHETTNSGGGGIQNAAYHDDDRDDRDDLHDIIEAFSPSVTNVKIPRPKFQKNPLRLFKIGHKNTNSSNS